MRCLRFATIRASCRRREIELKEASTFCLKGPYNTCFASAFPPKAISGWYHRAGLLALPVPTAFPSEKDSGKLIGVCGMLPHRNHSYGDSAGFAPASLLITAIN